MTAEPLPTATPTQGGNTYDAEFARPVGAWVIGGFLVAVICLMWILVAYIFNFRS